MTTETIAFVEASTTGAGSLVNRLAKQRGCMVILFSRCFETYSPEVLESVDFAVRCETNDLNAVCEAARQVHSWHPFDGVTTTADLYVPQAALIAEQLGLPNMPLSAASAARNKYKMRCILARCCPDASPAFELAFDTEQAKRWAGLVGYPIIAKPQNGDGSREVKSIHSEKDLTLYMESAVRWRFNSGGQPMERGVLLESYVEGEEFSVETLQSKGGIRQLIGGTRKFLTGGDRGFFVEAGHAFPIESELASRLFHVVSDCLDALGIDCGVIHTECRLRPDGSVVIIEINPRLAGGKIGSHLIEEATGRNPAKAVLDIALGDNVAWKSERTGAAALAYVCSDGRSGQYGGIKNEREVCQRPGVVKVFDVARIGHSMQLAESNADRLAVVLARGPNADDAYLLARAAADGIEF